MTVFLDEVIIDEAVRTSDGWKLAKVERSLIRQEGNRDIMRMAGRRPPTTTGSPQ